MHAFLISYTRRTAGREVAHRGRYVTFEYNPMRNTYRAIVNPSHSLGHHAVELSDITNLHAFANWLAKKCRQDQQQPAFPRLAEEIPLPLRQAATTCQLARISLPTYT